MIIVKSTILRKITQCPFYATDKALKLNLKNQRNKWQKLRTWNKIENLPE